MARWKLLAPHYLMVPGTRWEYQEIDRATGRPKRTGFDVPLHIDPRIEADWNHVQRGATGQIVDGMVVVARAGGAHDPADIIFTSQVTPDMDPLDDEARAESAKHTWVLPETQEALPEQATYADRVFEKLSAQVAEVASGVAQVAQPQFAGLAELTSMMGAMMKQNQELIQMLAAQALAKSAGVQQVVDEEEPLPEADPPTADDAIAPPVSRRITSRRPSVGAPV